MIRPGQMESDQLNSSSRSFPEVELGGSAQIEVKTREVPYQHPNRARLLVEGCWTLSQVEPLVTCRRVLV